MIILRHPDEHARGAIGIQPDLFAQGLLFVLPRHDIWPITVKEMNIPIDAYWLSESGMVLEHAELFPGMEDYWPEAQALYVLEFPMREQQQYKIGDFVELPP